MGTDHTAIPKDLRPLNIAPEGFFPNPPHEPTATTLSPRSGTGIGTAYLPSMASDSGLGFPNPGTAWNPSKPVSTTAVSAGFGGLGFREGTNSTNLEVSGRVGGNASGEIVGDCSGSTGATSNSRKVKFLCSFGGKILPRPSDSVLRYVGGHTRIISVRRDVRFEEFVQKMFETCGQPVVIKYQLPDEDLDALVSVSCAEDLENMMEEYGKLVERSADGSAKLRVFLFSPLEVEESVLVHFSDLQDSGQRFVEAVNGIPDVVVGSSRLTRRGSIVSATSTQNSDGVMSAGDVLDSHGTTGVGEVGGLISPGTTSPRVAAAAATAAPDVAARLTYIVPNSELQKPQAPPAVGRPQQPVAVDLQRTYGMEFPPGSPYVPSMDFPSSGASKDHRQDTFNIVDSTLFPSNTGFSSTQAIGLDGSLYRQIDHSQQFRDSFTALPPNHVIPVMQMTVPSSAAPVSARPNAVPQSPQHHQSQLNVYGYQPQSPPFLVPVTLQGGVVEWRQVPPPDHVVLSDGLTSYQQRPPLPESVPSFEDCYMCQKALPHAHSDTLIHEQRHNSPNASNPAFHSLRAEDNLWIQHPNRLPVSETSSESIAEHQGVKTQPRVAGQINHDTFTPQFGVHSLASNPDLLHDHESILLQRRGISDSSKMFNPATGGSSSDAHVHYGVHMDNATQFFQGLLPQQNVPLQDQVNHTAYLVSQPIGSDAGPIKPMNIKPPGQVAQESAMGYISKNPGIVTKDEIVGSRVTSDLRPIDGRMEALHISPPEVSGMIEQNVLPIGREQKHEEFSDVKQQMTGNAIYQNNGVTRPGIVPEQLRLVEMQSIPMAEGVQLNFRQPTETNQVTVSESYNVSGPHPTVTAAIPLMTTEEIWQGRPSFANAGSVHTNTGGLSPGDDWKYEASHVNSRMDANITVAGASSDTFSSSSPSYVGDAQNAISANSLFSHQDPWSLRHDPHFPPPRPTKVPASKEAFVVKEETVIPQPSGHLHDLGSENTRSVKGFSDEHIKQELQAVAEGVAASVLQSSTTSDHNACGTIGPTSEVYQPREDNDGDEEARCRNQLEDGKSELLEKMAPAFPFAENIGRLQV
ncbi:hypothetical protein Sjap_019361 [Stephania japonica]|uniref:PB1 domain-containing protein n=1 Tax=Stephania japonica TaxID=461633 RepID=A0AAP0F446_9MAGN